jgi:hypothetical protein
MGSLKGGTKFEFDYITCGLPQQRAHYQPLLKSPTMRQGPSPDVGRRCNSGPAL